MKSLSNRPVWMWYWLVKDFLWKALKIKKIVTYVFPLVDKELQFWLDRLEKAPCSFLAGQARASIASKRFHALGGSVFSLYSMVNTEEFIRFVVAFQTISDYLDNLCDRSALKMKRLSAASPGYADAGWGRPDLADYLYYPTESGATWRFVYTCKYQIHKGTPLSFRKPIFWSRFLYNDRESSTCPEGKRKETGGGADRIADYLVHPGESSGYRAPLGIYARRPPPALFWQEGK